MGIRTGRSEAGDRKPATGGADYDLGDDDGRDGEDRDDERLAFLESVRGVRKLAAAGPERVPPPPAPGGSAAREGPGRPAKPGNDGARLLVEDVGTSWTARADGVAQRVLRRIRDGTIAVVSRTDLHGLTRVAADRALDQFLTQAHAAEQRCLLVIHGRGHHSGPDGPALGALVRERLTRGPLARLVLACASAAPAQGGTGATVVYLRR